MEKLSKSQIDKLGERLRVGSHGEAELRLLDVYRRSFGDSRDAVVARIRQTLSLKPTVRLAKTTGSIVEKLRRESIRLSQMQDVAGCRIVVADLAEQDEAVSKLLNEFTNVNLVDRRNKPHFGYRAVHVMVRDDDKLVEVQVRTVLQHLWAELSEKLADSLDPHIKYGGGDAHVRRLLDELSTHVVTLEDFDRRVVELTHSGADGAELRVLEMEHKKRKQEFSKSLLKGIRDFGGVTRS